MPSMKDIKEMNVVNANINYDIIHCLVLKCKNPLGLSHWKTTYKWPQRKYVS